MRPPNRSNAVMQPCALQKGTREEAEEEMEITRVAHVMTREEIEVLMEAAENFAELGYVSDLESTAVVVRRRRPAARAVEPIDVQEFVRDGWEEDDDDEGSRAPTPRRMPTMPLVSLPILATPYARQPLAAVAPPPRIPAPEPLIPIHEAPPESPRRETAVTLLVVFLASLIASLMLSVLVLR
jgi:hypothetical protein